MQTLTQKRKREHYKRQLDAIRGALDGVILYHLECGDVNLNDDEAMLYDKADEALTSLERSAMTIYETCLDPHFKKFNADTINKPCPHCGDFMSGKLLPEQVKFHWTRECTIIPNHEWWCECPDCFNADEAYAQEQAAINKMNTEPPTEDIIDTFGLELPAPEPPAKIQDVHTLEPWQIPEKVSIKRRRR